MNDYPTLERTEYTHVARVTMPEQDPIKLSLCAYNNYDAFVQTLRQLFGDDRDQVMPPMILSVKRIKE